MIDVGYILGHQDEYEELRYSLRSLKFFPHRNVYIAGAPPPVWSQGLKHIPVEQATLEGRGEAGNRWWENRKTNMRRNLLALLDSDDVSDTFLYMNDDYMLTRPPGVLPHLGTFVETHRGQIDNKQGPYIDLYHWFQANGVPDPVHVSEHVPIVVDSRLAPMMREVWDIVGFPYASLWGNLTDVETVKSGSGDWVLNHQKDHSETWPDEWWSLSTVSNSFHVWPVGNKIRAFHPDRSPYENPDYPVPASPQPSYP